AQPTPPIGLVRAGVVDAPSSASIAANTTQGQHGLARHDQPTVFAPELPVDGVRLVWPGSLGSPLSHPYRLADGHLGRGGFGPAWAEALPSGGCHAGRDRLWLSAPKARPILPREEQRSMGFFERA